MNIFEQYLDKIKKILLDFSKNGDLILPDSLEGITAEIPPSKFNSDISTNVAMVLSKINKKPPIELANTLSEEIKKNDKLIDEISVVKPGFINIKFKPVFWTDFIKEIIQNSKSFGINTRENKKNYLIELQVAGDIFHKNPSSCTPQEIEEWSKISSVTFLGKVSDMVGFWQGCDVAILPSHREGFPKALLEAAACGLPLLGSDVPGVREIVVDGVNGLLFAKGDCQDIARKIEKIYADQEFRQSAGKASREVIKSRGLSNHAVEAAFVALFKSIKTRAAFANDR